MLVIEVPRSVRKTFPSCERLLAGRGTKLYFQESHIMIHSQDSSPGEVQSYLRNECFRLYDLVEDKEGERLQTWGSLAEERDWLGKEEAGMTTRV